MSDDLKLDPRFSSILPRRQILRGQVPKGNPLHNEFILAENAHNPDPFTTIILCKTCRHPLWKVTARVSDVTHEILSTKTTLFIPGLEINEPTCPLCHGLYFDARPDGTPKFLTSKGTL